MMFWNKATVPVHIKRFYIHVFQVWRWNKKEKIRFSIAFLLYFLTFHSTCEIKVRSNLSSLLSCWCYWLYMSFLTLYFFFLLLFDYLNIILLKYGWMKEEEFLFSIFQIDSHVETPTKQHDSKKNEWEENTKIYKKKQSWRN